MDSDEGIFDAQKETQEMTSASLQTDAESDDASKGSDECSERDYSDSDSSSCTLSQTSSEAAREAEEKAKEMERLLKEVPYTEEGSPTSVGSKAHPGQCSPCVFVAMRKTRCSAGVRCNFCHFPHKFDYKKFKSRMRGMSSDGQKATSA
eukprot:gb/GFBE01083084.1/.p1 GENE.gb/GFBE01083084.1/~~gb/GFBE01083084.1/.p1  ORF type:complete len:149 (+),score=30.43 gb/GFBE01083084.1/:1-447(+)